MPDHRTPVQKNEKNRRRGCTTTRASDLNPEPIRWLWTGHFPLGKLAVIAGPPSVGKSMLAAGDFAARVSTGRPWPDGSPCAAADVLIIARNDDPADTLVPRLLSHEADLRRVHFGTDILGDAEGDGEWGQGGRASAADQMFDLGGIATIDGILRKKPAIKLVIFDPASAFLDGSGNSSRGVLMRLASLAGQYGAAFIMAADLRGPGGAGGSPRVVVGSHTLVSTARSVWMLRRDAKVSGRLLLTPAKNSLGEARTGYGLRIEAGRIEWEPEPLTERGEPEDLSTLPPEVAAQRRQRRVEKASEFISQLLADGPRMWLMIRIYGEQAGHTASALYEARKIVAEWFKLAEPNGRFLWRLKGDTRTGCPRDDLELDYLARAGHAKNACGREDTDDEYGMTMAE